MNRCQIYNGLITDGYVTCGKSPCVAAYEGKQRKDALTKKFVPEGCELCSDTGPLVLVGRCHPLAPLRAEIDGDVLTLRCYIPECNRLVAIIKCVEVQAGLKESGGTSVPA